MANDQQLAGEDLAKDLYKKFRDYESFHQPKIERFLRYYQYFRCYISRGYFFETSKLVPYAFSTVMSILPRLVVHKPRLQYIMNRIPSNVLRNKELAERINSVEEMSTNDKILALNRMRENSASMMNIISDFQWEKISGDTRLSESLLNGLIYGTYISYYYWDKEKQSPMFEPLLPFNFFPDPTCNHARNLKRCFRRIYTMVDDLEEKFDEGFYTIPEDYRGDKEKFFDELKSFVTTNLERLQLADRIRLSSTHNTNEIEIIEYYEPNRIITMIGGSYIIRDVRTDLGELPFIIGYNTYCSGEFWGIGEVEMIEQHIEDATDIRANRKENMIMQQNNQWIVDMSKLYYEEDLVSAPNQIIRADGGKDAIWPVPKQPISRETYMEEDILRRDIVEVSGQAEYFRGTPHDGGVETATAINSLADTAQARWNLKLTNLSDYFLKPLGRKWIELNKKYLKPFEMRLDEKDKAKNYMTMTIDLDIIKSLNTDYELRVIPGNHRTTTKDQINTLMQILLSSETFIDKVHIEKLFIKLFEIFDIPVFDIIKTEEELRMEHEARMEQQQQQMELEARQQDEQYRRNIMERLRQHSQQVNTEQNLINRRL